MHSYTCSDGAKDWKSLALGQNMQEAIMHVSIDSVTPQYISIKLEFDPCDRVSPEEKQTIGTEHLMHLALIKDTLLTSHDLNSYATVCISTLGWLYSHSQNL